MSRKVILYVGGFELPDKNAAAQRCVSNAKIFRDIGYEVVFLGFDKKIKGKSALRKTEHFGFDSWAIPYPETAKEWLRYITSFNEVNNLIKQEYKNKVFAVICYNYPAIAQFRIKRLSKKYGVFSIADVTEWYGVSGSNLVHKFIKFLDTILRMKVVNPKMDALITTSPYLSKYYKKHRIDYVELPTLYDPDWVIQHKKREAEKREGCTITYAGSPFDVASTPKDRSKVKERLDVLINVMFNLSATGTSFVLNIFGVTENDYLNVYPEDAFKLDALRNKVLFKGRQSHSNVLENIFNSDFTIFFRDINRVTEAGFPSKFSESITCGVPVLTNLISNVEPFLIEGKNGYIIDMYNEKKQVNQLKHALCQSETRMSEMKRYCIESRIFDYKNYTENVKELFDKLK